MQTVELIPDVLSIVSVKVHERIIGNTHRIGFTEFYGCVWMELNTFFKYEFPMTDWVAYVYARELSRDPALDFFTFVAKGGVI